jgi:hypothetical protein
MPTIIFLRTLNRQTDEVSRKACAKRIIKLISYNLNGEIYRYENAQKHESHSRNNTHLQIYSLDHLGARERWPCSHISQEAFTQLRLVL